MLLYLIVKLVDIYTLLIFVYCILTWIPTVQGVIADIRDALGKIVNPYLDLFRRFVPPIGGMVDISPIIALLVLQFAVRILASILGLFM